ncbi:hypothetical protein AKJ09_03094 [Labilithrix luteola]|uniref:Uncharacterized protein n=1 Tax=Labilithrix luteola TaxID=1391654 RepID=A0A0K1PSB3_9BACT|nr:hypothetical protein AKJ09_03094 [Labilithrix luteola]
MFVARAVFAARATLDWMAVEKRYRRLRRADSSTRADRKLVHGADFSDLTRM